MPSAARSASARCKVTGSGVVMAPGTSPSGPSMPSVPTEAARRPASAQIWRVKLAVEVLPLVPVTAATVSGCGPCSSAASSARRRRGFSSTSTGTAASAWAAAPSASVRMAAAPRPIASAMKRRPSLATPGSATNSVPGETRRESAVIDRMSGSFAAARSASFGARAFMRSVSRNFGAHSGNIGGEGTMDVGRLLDRLKAQKWRHSGDDALHRRAGGPGAGDEAVGRLRLVVPVAVRLVDDDVDQILRIVHREERDQRRQVAVVHVAAVDADLLGCACLGADQIARHGGLLAG